MFFSDKTNADKWYKAKVNFITIDEKSGREKKTGSIILGQASDLEDALKSLIKGMGGTLADYEAASVIETKIMRRGGGNLENIILMDYGTIMIPD